MHLMLYEKEFVSEFVSECVGEHQSNMHLMLYEKAGACK